MSYSLWGHKDSDTTEGLTLSIICVRNKVSFALDEEDNDKKPNMTFNFDNAGSGFDSDTPAWVKAAMEVAKDMN